MSERFAVYLEVGAKRAFAGAVLWPGWCRSGRGGERALATLAAYADRYDRIVGSLELGFAPPADVEGLDVVERLDGDATTDFGAPSVAPAADAAPLEGADAERDVAILGACWDALAAAVETGRGRALATGPRGGGRSLEKIVEHVIGAEQGYLGRLGRRVPLPREVPLARVRDDVLEEVRAVIRDGVPPEGPRGGRRWTVRYYVRRAAWHLLDHAWEIEDRAQREA
jgi:hypothetical protein